MRVSRGAFYIGILGMATVVLALLAGCVAPQAINPVEPTATLAIAMATPEATATPTATPTPALLPSAENCITCHTSEETLKETAKKEEGEKEKLSEGEG